MSDKKASIPTFSSPIELIIPAFVSVIRVCLFPSLGFNDIAFVTIAPKFDTSVKALYSSAYPYVPDAVIIGFFRINPFKFTCIKEVIIAIQPHFL